MVKLKYSLQNNSRTGWDGVNGPLFSTSVQEQYSFSMTATSSPMTAISSPFLFSFPVSLFLYCWVDFYFHTPLVYIWLLLNSDEDVASSHRRTAAAAAAEQQQQQHQQLLRAQHSTASAAHHNFSSTPSTSSTRLLLLFFIFKKSKHGKYKIQNTKRKTPTRLFAIYTALHSNNV